MTAALANHWQMVLVAAVVGLALGAALAGEFSVTGDVEYNTNPETEEPERLSIKRTATSHLGISDANVEVRRGEPEPSDEESKD